MAKVTWKQKAIDDLTDIWVYTRKEWSEKQADTYYESIRFACKKIGENPGIGKKYTQISSQLFGLKSGKHIIFYQPISKDEIEVIRILHERMDLKNKMVE